MHRMLRWSVCEGRERREWAEVAPEMHLGGKARDQGCFVLCRIRCDSGGKFTVYPPRARTSPLPSTYSLRHNSSRHPRNKGLKRMIRLWIPGFSRHFPSLATSRLCSGASPPLWKFSSSHSHLCRFRPSLRSSQSCRKSSTTTMSEIKSTRL